MIAPIRQRRSSQSVPNWHEVFMRMAPAIETHAKIAFRHLRPDERAEAVQDVLCNVCAALARLDELDKLDIAYVSVLARFGVSQVRDGRKVGCHLNIRDVSSPYCQRRKKLTIERLDRFDDEENQWVEAIVEDTHTPVFDQVWFRVDFPTWLDTLRRRDRKIALKLAAGEKTGRVARMFRVSAGRISQLRRELHDAWCRFQGEDVEPNAATA